MRFDRVVYFQKESIGTLNPATGNYENETSEEVKNYANITNAGTNTLNKMFGNIKEGSLIVRIMNEYKAPFDYICIAGKRYKVDFSRVLRRKHIFVVSEVQ
jgi:hypothetical protein